MRKKIYILTSLLILFCMTIAKNQVRSDISDNSKNQVQEITKDDFQSFWVGFRNAIISLDYIQLMEMTDFPLKCHGKKDVDPQFLAYRDRFYLFFKACLNEESGRTKDGETNLDFIKRTTKLEESQYFIKGENWCRVMAMEFRKIDNHWKLTLIYINTGNYKDK